MMNLIFFRMENLKINGKKKKYHEMQIMNMFIPNDITLDKLYKHCLDFKEIKNL